MEHKWKLSEHKNAKELVAKEVGGPLKTECWHVTSHKANKQGYPIINHGGNRHKRPTVARVMYEMYKGAIPENMVIRHKCDDKGCINPEHLLAGTHHDNTRDMIDRGRHMHGEKAPWSKLSKTSVEFIRELRKVPYHHGMFPSLAKWLNVSPTTIKDVYYGRTWNYDE